MPFSLLFAFFFTFCLFFVENLKSIGKKKGRGGVYIGIIIKIWTHYLLETGNWLVQIRILYSVCSKC